jgi:aminoglycoside 6'-N-acetyltransferase I
LSRYGLEIRAAAAADAALLSQTLEQAGVVLAPSALAERIEAVRQAGGVLLAWEWGPPSGVIAFSRQPSLLRAGLAAQVTTLFVAPDARRRGIARLLLKAASQAARQAGCDTLLMGVAGDPSLEAFCIATGFSPACALLERPLRKRS